ncbi:sulfur carrier protein ThiS [Vogesella urethralis]|uniref:sulfur carrier protein ThiS n=1 Tax=Vogesella urethralis TaxID=2592656 RepID=UPI0011868827|nr:sulfur carrier protein ThiS [Vogesella urethralis]
MPSIRINGEERRLDAAIITLAALVTELGLTGKRIAIERNGEIVPRSQHANTPLAEGDELEIVVAVGGG